MKVLFLDRDGVINIDHGHVSRIEDFVFIDGIFELCKYYISKNYKVIVVTNQTGIGLGLYTLDDFIKVNNYMLEEFKKHGVDILDVFYCPHDPNSNCECRKPKPKMFFDAKDKYNIDLKNSIMVGDKVTDAIAAYNAGIKNIYLINNNEELDFNVLRVKTLLEVIK